MFDFKEASWLKAEDLPNLSNEIERCWNERVIHHKFLTNDGLSITAAEIRPLHFSAQLVIIPGRGETAHKYAEIFYSFERMGIRAAVLFPRGQGLSDRLLPDRQKCHIVCFNQILSDLNTLITQLKFDEFGMLAFSLGGLEAISYVYEYTQRPQALVLLAPFFWPANKIHPVILRCVVGVLGHLPRFKTSFTPYGQGYHRIDFESNYHSHCKIRYQRYHDYYANHSDLTIGSPTWGFVAQTTAQQVRLRRLVSELPVKTLFMNSEFDQVVAPSAVEDFCKRHEHDKLTPELITIKQAFHDVLNEKDEIRNPALTQAMKFLKDNGND